MQKFINKTDVLIIIFIILLIGVIYSVYISFRPSTFQSTSISEEKNTSVNEKSFQKHLIFIGDSGTGKQPQYDVANQIAEYCKKNICDSMLINGDVFYDAGVSNVNDSAFDLKFERPYSVLNFPIHVSFGNHDYLGCEECLLQYASTRNTKLKMPSSYYTYKVDNVEVFVIDTENFNKTQQNWLENSINKSNSKWKVVAGHRPLLTFDVEHHNESWSGNNDLKNIICDKVDLLISAHSHVLEDNGNIDNCKFRQLVSGGGGATPRTIVPHSQITYSYSDNGFLSIVEQLDGKLLYEFIDVKGTLLHSDNL